MKKISGIVVVAVMTIMAIGAWTGCEQAEGIDGISLNPPAATIGGSSSNGTSVAFTANVSGALALPLEWRVSNASLGWIANHSGSNAVYKGNRNAKGDNIITVRDQYGNEGSAVVTHQ
jgi:hypothetical protein